MGVTDVYMKQWEYSDSKESVLLPKFKKKKNYKRQNCFEVAEKRNSRVSSLQSWEFNYNDFKTDAWVILQLTHNLKKKSQKNINFHKPEEQEVRIWNNFSGYLSLR